MEGNKRRTGQPEQVPRKLRAEAKIVSKFWGVHYRYNSSSLPRKVEAADAYRLCLMVRVLIHTRRHLGEGFRKFSAKTNDKI